MPNFMSDVDRALSEGDAWQCEHCKAVLSVDEAFHSCPEGIEAARQSAVQFHKDFFGDGTHQTRQFLVTIVAPNTEMAFDEAWDSMATWAKIQSEDTDEILGYAWQVKEIK